MNKMLLNYQNVESRSPYELHSCYGSKASGNPIWERGIDESGNTYEWPDMILTGLPGERISQVLSVLSTDPVTIMKSLYLLKSIERTSKSWALMVKVDVGCRRSHNFTVQSPEADAKDSALVGLLLKGKLQILQDFEFYFVIAHQAAA